MTYKRRCFSCGGNGLNVWKSENCPSCGGSGEIDDHTVPVEEDWRDMTTAELVRVEKVMDHNGATTYRVSGSDGPCYMRVGTRGVICDRHGALLCEGRTRLACSGLLKSDPNHNATNPSEAA